MRSRAPGSCGGRSSLKLGRASPRFGGGPGSAGGPGGSSSSIEEGAARGGEGLLGKSDDDLKSLEERERERVLKRRVLPELRVSPNPPLSPHNPAPSGKDGERIPPPCPSLCCGARHQRETPHHPLRGPPVVSQHAHLQVAAEVHPAFYPAPPHPAPRRSRSGGTPPRVLCSAAPPTPKECFRRVKTGGRGARAGGRYLGKIQVPGLERLPRHP